MTAYLLDIDLNKSCPYLRLKASVIKIEPILTNEKKE